MTDRDAGLKKLRECRDRIDDLDRRILALINERTRIVEEIGRVKREISMPIYEPKREDEVFRNVTEHNQGPLSEEAVRRLFERVIDEMRAVQREHMLKEKGEAQG